MVLLLTIQQAFV